MRQPAQDRFSKVDEEPARPDQRIPTPSWKFCHQAGGNDQKQVWRNLWQQIRQHLAGRQAMIKGSSFRQTTGTGPPSSSKATDSAPTLTKMTGSPWRRQSSATSLLSVDGRNILYKLYCEKVIPSDELF